MRVIFNTNIDAYKTNCFPVNLTIPPRTGDLVMVVDVFVKHYQDQKLPITLEVTRVTWREDCVVCELWYNETQKKMADLAGAKTL